jgi:hypothetical protein
MAAPAFALQPLSAAIVMPNLAEDQLAPAALLAHSRAWDALSRGHEEEVKAATEALRDFADFDTACVFRQPDAAHRQAISDIDGVLGFLTGPTARRTLQIVHERYPDIASSFDTTWRVADRKIRIVRTMAALLIGEEDLVATESTDIVDEAEDLLAAELVRRHAAEGGPTESWDTGC